MVRYQREAPDEVDISMARSEVVSAAQQAVRAHGLEGRVRVVAFRHSHRQQILVTLWATLPISEKESLKAVIAEMQSHPSFSAVEGYRGQEAIFVGPYLQPTDGCIAIET